MRASQTPTACPASTGVAITAVAVANWTTLAYDILGRLTQRNEPEYITTWSFDKLANGTACNKGIGKLCEVVTSNGVNRKISYDSFGRAVNTRTNITSGPSFASAMAYDNVTGRAMSQIYPTGLQVNYNYTAKGFMEKLTLGTAATISPLPTTPGGTPGAGATLAVGSVLWQAVRVNASGKTEQQTYGNGVTNTAVFDGLTGRTTALTAGAGTSTNVLNQTYAWDSINNLTMRADNIADGQGVTLSETFAYDALNRTTSYTVSGPSAIPNSSRTVNLTYNVLGSILYKSDVGVYGYSASGAGAVRPHALQSVTATSATNYTYDLNGNLISASAGSYRTIAYTSFNQPDSNTGVSGPGIAANGATAVRDTWSYDENHSRIKQVHTVTGGALAGTRTTWYLHPDAAGGLSFESEINAPTVVSAANPAVTSNRHYLSAGGQVFGVLVSNGALPTLTAAATAPPAISTIALRKVEYWHKDHLGSLTATTDHAGAVTARYAYDPFGKRRYINGAYDAFGALVIDWNSAVSSGTARGFTGHEMLDDVGLIHMNGRL